jgi:hypothetical protein
MTEEQYLRATGWTRGELSTGKAWWERHGRRLPLADAVEAQLVEDRARLAFVLERTPELRLRRGEAIVVNGQPDPRTLPKRERSLQDIDPGFYVPAAGLTGPAK